MAQIKPFEGNVQFQSSAQGGRYDPGTIPNPNAGLAAKLATINESFDNMRQSGIANIEARSKELQELSRFSETLGKTMMQANETYLKNEQEQADLLFAEDAFGQQKAIDELNPKEDELKRLDNIHEATAAEAIRQGAPVEIVERLKQLSGARGYYYRRNAAKYAGDNFQTWIQDKFLNDEREFEIEGIRKPINSQDWAPQHRAYIMKKLLGEYFQESGLDQVSRGLQAKYALPQIAEVQSKLMGVFRKEYGIQQSTIRRDDLDANFSVDFDLNKYLQGLSITYNERGEVIGYSGGWQHALKRIQEMFDAGMMNNAQLAEVEQQIDPETGKKFIERWPVKFQLLRESLATENRKNFADDEADIEMQFKQEEEALRKFFFENNPSQADVDAAQKDLITKYGRNSQVLDEIKSTYTVEALDLKRIDEQFKNLADQGLLTTEMVAKTPFDVRTKWMPIAQKMQETNIKMKNFKEYTDSIQGLVLNFPRVKAMPGGPAGGLAPLVVGELQSKFMQKVVKYMALGDNMNSEQAAQQALAEVTADFEKGIVDPKNRYFMNDEGKFINILPKNSVSTAKIAADKLSRVNKAIDAYSNKALSSIEGLIFSKAELIKMEQGYGTPAWRVPGEAQYWANKLTEPKNPIDALTIINRQRKAAKLPELPTPQAVEVTKRGISPELQYLLNRYPSPNRSTRALSSMRGFVTQVIPGGYGPTILKAARTNGIDPSILAGLLETESGFRTGVTSSAGARGIAQIVPEYHPGVNPDDPIASINYVAKWLSSTQKQFDGDMRLAILAYNGGTPRISKYRGPIPGSKENQEYYGKVIKAASKYGYSQAWDDPATMRGKFQVIEYLTGDRAHRGYRDDHGGGNYHEHIAFSTTAERNAAIKKLKAAGIKVGSVDRPGDPGYHGKGLAIDVPASQVPPGQEQELSRRVRSILGIG